ncbi:MAG TPA: GNAT family N-acetyltransferase [Dysgonomonas sp.]|nr:GNAT family N-acetyltransferase [Dysgonomonas sp.]
MCGITIRKAVENDIFEIRRLFQETILTVNRKDYTEDQAECWADRGENKEVWKERIKEQYFIVAVLDELITGFAALKPDGYLNSLFVHKDYQGCGVASALLYHIENHAISNNLTLITADVSITALPFFLKKGYKIIQEQTVDIGVKMINYKMEKDLKTE